MSMTILRKLQREELEQSLALLNGVTDARAKEAADRIRATLYEADQEDYLTPDTHPPVRDRAPGKRRARADAARRW